MGTAAWLVSLSVFQNEYFANNIAINAKLINLRKMGMKKL